LCGRRESPTRIRSTCRASVAERFEREVIASATISKAGQTLGNDHATSRMVIFIGGGMVLEYDPVFKKRDQAQAC